MAAKALVLLAAWVLVTSVAAASTFLATSRLAPPAVTFPPPAGFNFTAAGDYTYIEAGRTGEVMAKVRTLAPSFHLALGDLNSSATPAPGMEANWCAMMKSYVNDVEVVSGNHDDGQATGDNISRIAPACPFTLGTATGTYSREYYFDFPQSKPLARFILTSCGLNFQAVDGFNNYFACKNSTTDVHYQFAKRAIDGAHTARIPWVIVSTHMHIVVQANTTTYVNQDFVNLLMYEKVDLILHGHVHNYQRSSQLRCFPETMPKFDPACITVAASPYVKGMGPVDVVVGTGAQYADPITNACPYAWWQACHGRMYGFLFVTVTATTLSAGYIWTRSTDGTGPFSDSFAING